MTSWIAVAVVGLGSYALRVVPLLYLSRVELRERHDRALHHAATAAFAALVAASTMQAEARGGPGSEIAALVALAVAAGLTWSRRPLVIAVAAGLASHALATVVLATAGAG